MIKYKTTGYGDRFTNMEIKAIVDNFYKDRTKGMRCGECQKNTIIIFKKYKPLYGCFIPHFKEICCHEFKKKIEVKIGVEYMSVF